jgi:hypothetical protein
MKVHARSLAFNRTSLMKEGKSKFEEVLGRCCLCGQ